MNINLLLDTQSNCLRVATDGRQDGQPTNIGTDLYKALASVVDGCGAKCAASMLTCRAIESARAGAVAAFSPFDGVVPDPLPEAEHLVGRHVIEIDERKNTASVAGAKLDLSAETVTDIVRALRAQAISENLVPQPKVTSAKTIPHSTRAPDPSPDPAVAAEILAYLRNDDD